jgi:hypothetical protein
MLKTKIIKTSNYFIKILIIILSFGFIAYRLLYKHDVSELADGFVSMASDKGSRVILMLVFVMMFLNWAFETVKWQYLIKKIEKVSFINSFMAVWAGLTASSFTPNRTGEYFARAFILDKANRWEGIFITFIGSLSQLIPTMLFGTIAGFFFVASLQDGPFQDKLLIYYILLGISVIFTSLVLIFYFRVSWLKHFFQKLIPKKYAEFRAHFEVYSGYSFRELFHALVLSIMRYIIFSIQFYLLIRICHINIPFWDGIMLVCSIFLVTTAIPTFAMTELGVRGSVSILLFDMYFQNNAVLPDLSSEVFLSSFMIWFINLIIPAIIGGFFVFKLKFFRK